MIWRVWKVKILLLGKNGQIGWELQRTLAPLGIVIALSRSELDLTDPNAIRRTVRSTKPDLIINAAAYTAVDKAEEEQELAMAINGTAPGILAEETSLLDASLIHYSTDYVFNGVKKKPYTEEDQPNPLNVYGKTKLAGEEAIKVKDCNYLIIRTGWVYGLRGNNFLLTILKMISENNELCIVSDQYGSPTWARMVAEATAQIIIYNKIGRKIKGTYHLASSGQTSWHGFAEAIINYSYKNSDFAVNIRSILTKEYCTPAVRPKYTVLDCSLFQEVAGIKLPHWHDMLKLVLYLK
jgi:dTDP-4-dehydrorhamnose reductase